MPVAPKPHPQSPPPLNPPMAKINTFNDLAKINAQTTRLPVSDWYLLHVCRTNTCARSCFKCRKAEMVLNKQSI